MGMKWQNRTHGLGLAIITVIAAACLVHVTYKPSPVAVPEPGDFFFIGVPDHFMAPHPALNTRYPVVTVGIDGISYDIAVARPLYSVVSVSTRDKKFTVDGLSVGSPVRDARALDSDPDCILGWECLYELPSGWHAAVLPEKVPPNDGAPVTWFVKKKTSRGM